MEEDLNINMRNSRQGLLGGSVVKNPPANTGDTVQSLSREDPLEKGNSNPLQNSCLGNPVNRGAWWATVCRVAKVRHDLMIKQQQHKRELPREVRKRLPLPVRMKKVRGDCCSYFQ